MPGLRPVSDSVDVFALTGPWHVASGPALAWYHHCAVWPSMFSVAVFAATAVTVSSASVVNAAAVASRLALAHPVAL